jgi:hypothetical protein
LTTNRTLVAMIASGSQQSASNGRGAVHPETASPRAFGFGLPTGRPIGAETACTGNLAPVLNRLAEVKAPVSPEPQTTREVPRSQFPRIRSWVKYGMTAAQVAEVYEAAVDDIERIPPESLTAIRARGRGVALAASEE